MAIRFDPALTKEVRKVVNNFNAKRRRLEKLGYTGLPEPISIRDLRQIGRRRELYSVLSDIKLFSQRGMEAKIKSIPDKSKAVAEADKTSLTIWEATILKRQARRSKISIARAIKAKEERLKTAKYKADLKQSIEDLKYRKDYLSKKITTLGRQGLRTFRKMVKLHLRRKALNDQFYENFFDMLFKSAYVTSDIDPNQLDEIERKLRQLTPDQLAQAFEEEPIINSIVSKYNLYVNGETSKPSIKNKNSFKFITPDKQLSKQFKTLSNNVDRIVERYK